MTSPARAFFLLAAFLTPVLSRADELASGFVDPPAESRPETWFHLIGGNVDREFLTTDLEAVSAAGLSGIQLFHGRGGEWPGVAPQIQTLSPTWDRMLSHVADETQRLGLRFTMQNCPGWAMSGGPWITPDRAMRHLIWSRTGVEGGAEVKLPLPRPQPSEASWRDYQEVAVIAFPTPTGDTGEFLKPSRVTSNLPDPGWSRLVAGEADAAVRVPSGEEPVWVEFTFDEPTTIRSIELPPVELLMARRNFVPESRLRIQTKRGAAWEDLVTHRVPYGNWQDRQPMHPLVFAVPDASAERFRLVFENGHPMAVSRLRLSSTARVNDWRTQAGYVLRKIYRTEAPQQADDSAIARDSILDLSDRLDAEGRLTWRAPAGRWTVLRLGHVNTGVTNKPAPPEATGFECDKLSPAGAEQHFAGYIGRVSAEGGPADGGRLQGMLIDSWECYTQTWTPAMEASFAERRGYGLRDWLPALAGYVVEDHGTTERFLRDWRLTISDLLVENYFGRLAELARERGMRLSFETAIGDVSPGDILRYHGKADIPMCEIWQPNDPHWGGYEAKPIHPTVSAAHVYGKTRVAAEAFTNIDHDWSDHPFSYKHVADRNFALGVNHLVFHTYTHNPRDKVPGTSFGSRIGSPFIRGQTWWKHMPEFTAYLARCQHLLQQGQPVADVLWYLGDDLNHRPLQNLAVPDGYDFDYVNQDVLLNRLEVVDGELRTPEGAAWRVLWLPETTCRRLTPVTLLRLKGLLTAGATVVGPPPQQNPSLVGGGAADKRFAALVDELWGTARRGDRRIGKGRLIWGADLEEALLARGVEPDVVGLRPQSWHHRRVGETDLYFVTADRETPLDATVEFRAAGRPELWDPLTKKRHALSVYKSEKGRTRVPLRLPAAGSAFLVFRHGEADPAFTRVSRDGDALLDANDRTRTDSGLAYPHLGIQIGTPIQPSLSPQPPVFEMTDDGGRLLAFENGDYRLDRPDGSSRQAVAQKATVLPIDTTWRLTFPKPWVAAEEFALEELRSWPTLTDADARVFSGTANYTTTVRFGESLAGRRAILDLGRVENLAEVLVNGHAVATLWAPPFRTDVTEWLQPGENRLEVRVTNTWHNRLSHDASLAPADRKTWTRSGPSKNSDPKPAGLLGPVVIRLAEVVEVMP